MRMLLLMVCHLFPNVGRGISGWSDAERVRRSRRLIPSQGAIVLIAVTALCADGGENSDGVSAHWSRFHGPAGRGYASGSLAADWSDDDYAWRYTGVTADVGSPVIYGGRVYFLASRPESRQIAIECLDLFSGERRWSRSFAHGNYPHHRRNTPASSTPAADADGVVIAYAEPEHTYLKAFDHDGNELWSRDFGRWQGQHGFGGSPNLVGSLVVLMNSQQAERLDPDELPGESRVIAVDRATGETVWETKLATTRTCYGVPAVYRAAEGGLQLVGANTGNGLFGLDALTGRMLWSLPVFDKRCCSSPLVVGDIAIGTNGSGGGGNELVAVRIPGPDQPEPQEIYRIERAAPYVPTVAVKGDWLFAVDDKGIASCCAVASGEVIWSRRIGGNFGASPIVVGDKMLIISLDGKATILRAGPSFEELGQIDLGGPVGATPAYAQGCLVLRVGAEIRCLKQAETP